MLGDKDGMVDGISLGVELGTELWLGGSEFATDGTLDVDGGIVTS